MATSEHLQNAAGDQDASRWSSIIEDSMPSIRSLSAFALSAFGAAQSVFGSKDSVNRPIGRDLNAFETCSNPQLSCHNTSVVENLCCFNAPGGTLLQTQFWDTHPVTGPVDSWTIHGLLPDNCDGTYEQYCDVDREYTNITQILQSFGQTDLLKYMQTYWVSDSGSSESFWEHEWGKHGTCLSTFDTSCYSNYQPTQEVSDFFNRVVSLFQSLPTYEWLSEAGINPSTTGTYTTGQIQAALSKHHGGYQVYLGCSRGALTQVWYFFNVAGSIQNGTFEPTSLVGSSSTCPSTGIKYLPKSSGSSPTTTSTSGNPAPTSPGTPFSGRGHLNVYTSGSRKGCIISGGKWYTTGTCATFIARSTDDGFTLRSSKGDCAINDDGALTCAKSVTSASMFSAEDGKLSYEGQSTFHADGVPRGWKQGTVYVGEEYATNLTIEWQSA